jgi:hypothetical protein
MRTKLTIMAIVAALDIAAATVGILLILLLGGWTAAGIIVGLAGLLLLAYRYLIQPWHARWGATDEEAARPMPGDEFLEGASSRTRAISIDARPEEVWPWLVQLGYGRAGWYSYDWIDNDGRPSASRIVPELQHLEPGDQIAMVPGMGPRVRAVEPNRYLVAGDADGGTWCLALYPIGDGRTRLVSRWRARWPITLATVFWVLVGDPGSFVMERKMLLNLKARAEHAAAGAEFAGRRQAGVPGR